MTAPTRRSAVLLAVAAGLTAVPACKRMERAARLPVTSIDEAERALTDNAARLAGFGIVPSPPVGGAEEAPLSFSLDEQDSATAEAPDGPGQGGQAAPDSGMAPPFEQDPSATASSTPAPEPKASAKDRADAGTGRCARICDVAESTCELAQQICGLAAGHPGEPRYEQACTRATGQCRAASAACDRCE